MRRRAGLALLLLAAAGAGCTRPSAAAHSGGAPAVPVTTSEARLADVPEDVVTRVATLKTEEAQAPDADVKTTREFRLCLGSGAEQKPLLFGLHPQPKPEAARPRKRTKRH